MRNMFYGLLPALSALVVVGVVGCVLILAIGQDPWQITSDAIQATLLSGYGLGQVFFKATPLILTGLAVSIPFAAGLFNIGGEGQLILGGLGCAVVAQALIPYGGLTAAAGGLVMAAVLGAMGGAIAGALKASRNVHEVISTIMLNFIFTALCGYLLNQHLEEPGTAHTPELPAEVLFTRLSTWMTDWSGSLASTSLLLALVCVAAAQVLMFHTVLGYELRVGGSGPLAARHAGIPSTWLIIGSLGLGGGLAGLAGGHFVLGARRFFEEGMSGGEGFLGIAVALMARGQPWAVVPAALIFGALSQAGLSLGTKVPREMVQVLQALVVLTLAGVSAVMRYRVSVPRVTSESREG